MLHLVHSIRPLAPRIIIQTKARPGCLVSVIEWPDLHAVAVSEIILGIAILRWMKIKTQSTGVDLIKTSAQFMVPSRCQILYLLEDHIGGFMGIFIDNFRDLISAPVMYSVICKVIRPNMIWRFSAKPHTIAVIHPEAPVLLLLVLSF